MNKILIITLSFIASQSMLAMEENKNPVNQQLAEVRSKYHQKFLADQETQALQQAKEIEEALLKETQRAAVIDRDRMMHDFLHDHNAFQELWGRSPKTVGYHALPRDLNALMAQQVIAPVLAMLKKKMNTPYRTFIDPTNQRAYSIAQFNTAGTMLVTVPQCYHAAKIWDITTGKCIHTLAHQATYKVANGPNNFFDQHTEITSAEFNSTGDRVVTTARDGGVTLWNLTTGKNLTDNLGCRVNSAAFNQAGTQIVISTENGNVPICDVSTGTMLCTLKHENVNQAKFNRPGNLIATVSCFGTVKIWDVATEACTYIFGHTHPVNTVEFNHTGNMIVITTYRNNAAMVYDLTTGTCRTLQHDAEVRSAEFNQADDMIVTASHDRTAKIWDVTTGTCLRTLAHDSPARGAKFNQKGDMILTWDLSTKSAKIWDATSGICTYTMPHASNITTAQFNQSGNMLVTTLLDGSARIWHIGNYFAAMKFLEKDITLEQAMLLNCIYQTALNNKLLEKRGQTSGNKFDFNKFPHLQEYFMQLPEGMQQALGEYVVLNQETNSILNSNN